MKVLSLFDGMSCGQIALNRAGIKYDNYYASEIDKYAIKITQKNYPDTIQIGNITSLQISKKTLYLSEVVNYIKEITGYELSSLQDTISEQEILYRLDRGETFAKTIGTQIKKQSKEVSKNTAICLYDKVWFFKSSSDNTKRKYDIIRSGERGKKSNKGWLEPMLEYSFWWNGNGQYKSKIKEKSIRRVKRTYCKNGNKRKIKKICYKPIFISGSQISSKRNGFKAIQRSCKKEELLQCYNEDRQKRVSQKKENNRREKKIYKIYNSKEKLYSYNDSPRVIENNRIQLRFRKKMEITVVKCEWGILIFKGSIELAQGGSPCQGFSFAGKQLNFEDPRSKLFFEYVRLLKELKPKYFMFENVRMKKEYQNVISEYLSIQPVMINSSLVSAQNRVRLYWTNIPGDDIDLFDSRASQPKDKEIMLKDIIETGIPDRDKSFCIDANYFKGGDLKSYFEKHRRQLVFSDNGLCQTGEANIKGNDSIKRVYSPEGKSPCLTTMEGGHREPKININTSEWRKLTPLECERLQTVEDDYTKGVSNTQRYKMLGNGWTVDIIAHIFKGLK